MKLYLNVQKNILSLSLIYVLIINISVNINSTEVDKHETFALIVNTSNDFPNASPPANNTDAFPGQTLQAYYALKSLGYDDDHIVLMVYHEGDDFIDYDGDGKNDPTNAIIDLENDDITKENLRNELQKIKNRLGYNDELIIYLVNHGCLMSSTSAGLYFDCGDMLSEEELSSWLKDVYCEKIVILADFCYSGNFISSLAEPGRICISSSENDKISWYYWDWTESFSEDYKGIFGNSGSVFFHPFWVKIKQGYSFQEAFSYANETYKRWINVDPDSKETVEAQNPQISAKERTFIDEVLRFFRWVWWLISNIFGLHNDTKTGSL